MAAARSVAMTGGHGVYSYSNNSSFQREVIEAARDLTWGGILEKLDISQLHLQGAAKSFCVADFGCSTGPNTFLAIDIITKAVEVKFQSEGLEVPEFQVFFNDTISNDFNTLFASLQPERRYFTNGVPGSFHGRLFPASSLHLIYSSCSVHWLSKIPEEVLDETSPAWNGGNILYDTEEEAVQKAFAAQFRIDLGAFLKHRAEELVGGGLACIVVGGLEDGNRCGKTRLGMQFQLLGSCLNDMADKGVLSRSKVDSFNLPMYFPHSKDLQSVIEENGDFEVEKLEKYASPDEAMHPTAADASAKLVRSMVEGLVEEQFGSVLIDEIFELYKLKFPEALVSFELQVPDRFIMFFALLKRKPTAK